MLPVACSAYVAFYMAAVRVSTQLPVSAVSQPGLSWLVVLELPLLLLVVLPP